VYSYEEEHTLLIFPIDSEEVSDEFPVAVDVDSEILFLALD
jgi:hypothetical protein